MNKDIVNIINESVSNKIEQIKEDVICESTYNRVINYLEKYECAIITAWRNEFINVTDKTFVPFKHVKGRSPKHKIEGAKLDNEKMEVGDKFTMDQKRYYNSRLKAILLRLGYSVTKVRGSYREIGQDSESQEESFLVVNVLEYEDFKSRLFKLSEAYNQDSFLYSPKNSEEGFLIGTNEAEFPGYGKEVSNGWLKKCAQSIYMSRFKSRGFTFTNGEKVSKDDPDRIKKLSSDDNNYEDDEPKGFMDRKAARERKKIENEINENVKKILNLETFDSYGVNGKHCISLFVAEEKKRLGLVL